MNKFSVKLPYDSTNEQIIAATTILVHDIYKDYLGYDPTTEDRLRFTYRINPNNSSINDYFCDGKKFGSLAVSFLLDTPKGISLDFISEN